MSWASRLSLGRFSPFTRTPPNRTEVSDADFSYITTDDLKQHEREQQQQRDKEREKDRDVDLGPPRDTDKVVLRNKRESYAVHFPVYSIAKGELSIGDLRASASKKLGGDARRIKLLYRGKNLKDDGRTCRSEGLKDGSELMCTIGEPASSSDDDSDSDVDGAAKGGDDEEARKRRRNRNKNKKRRDKKKEEKRESGTSTPTQPSINLRPPPTSHANSTSRGHSPSRPSSSQAPGGTATPQTAIAKLDALRDTLRTFVPQCEEFRKNPPSDPAKKDFEHKRLSETILTQVLLKLDAVETEGDEEARGRRKELVKETQALLRRVDEVVGSKKATQL
ncbi:hypothetical protein K431DRAFT_247604 [Polychaeton citri CBS 116435]|uniref:BAG domain-containing protein n=1 Tax=Polychaeton citri CBS 116435 TaxID=1314669 RepID=A0A9P4Q621_9PEZI|nr:hypothetical protein K431DRAFT_247604 [Polychaeton citri CBS 116435]